MSRILKRPMFRKGGEVMEGIMTGITPRKMYDEGSLNTADQGVIDNVRRKMSLIDVISGSGSSPLGDPLTQFLLSTGQNLIGGESAGGTKLQELAGATKQPLAQAFKAQQLRDLSKRKLATSLISKIGTGGLAKFRETARGLLQISGIEQAEKKILDNDALYKSMDTSNPYIANDDYEEATSAAAKDSEGKEVKIRVFVPDDKDDFRPNKRYFLIDEGIFVTYDSANNRLIEVPGI